MSAAEWVSELARRLLAGRSCTQCHHGYDVTGHLLHADDCRYLRALRAGLHLEDEARTPGGFAYRQLTIERHHERGSG